MNNLELADKLQDAASNHYGDLCGMLWDAGAALRNLHTENMALRCTEMALRDVNAELVEALKGLDEAYCRSGSSLTRDERTEDRKRLMYARAALAKAEGGEL